MRFTLAVLTTLLSFSQAASIEKRQNIDFAAYDSIPELPDVAPPAGDEKQNTLSHTYDATSVARAAIAAATAAPTMLSGPISAGLSKRSAACSPNQPGTGPAVQPDSAANFQSYQPFSDNANGAVAPFGYNAIYKDGKASAQDSTYMTYTMLNSYDVGACAAFCQRNAGCNSFNIYYERDPSVVPGLTCENPSSLTYIKCAIYGGALLTTSAKNTGQWQSNFQVVIAGSNIYVAIAPSPVSGFNGPFTYGNRTIQAPLGYMGVQTFSQSQPYDPSVCAAACDQKSAFDVAHGLPSAANSDICNFFVAYVLYKNGINGVFTCTYYTYAWSPSYATNNGQYDAQGNHYTIGYSNGYAKVGAAYDGVCTSYGVSTVTPAAVTSTATTTMTTTLSTTTTTSATTDIATKTVYVATQTVNKKRANPPSTTSTTSCVFSPTATTTLDTATVTTTSTVYTTVTPILTLQTTISTTSTISATTTTTSVAPTYTYVPCSNPGSYLGETTCGPNNRCVCGKSTSGVGICNTGDGQCGDFPRCSKSSDCAAGTFCELGTACGYPLCYPAYQSVCGNPTVSTQQYYRRDDGADVFFPRDVDAGGHLATTFWNATSGQRELY